MRFGVSGDIIPDDMRDLTPAVAARVRELGFTGIFSRFRANDPFETPDLLCHGVRDMLLGEGVEMVMCTGYWQRLIDPDEMSRRRAARTLAESLRVAGALGARCIDTGPGSMHPTGPWNPHPDNWAPWAVEQLVKSLREAAPAAEDSGVSINLEGHVLVTLSSPEVMAQVIDAVGSPMVKCDLDPVNWITLDTVFDTTPALMHMFAVPGDRIASAHAKDVEIWNRLVVHIDSVPAGEGRLDYRAFMQGLEALDSQFYLIIEGCPQEKLPKAKAFLDEQAALAGVKVF